MNVTSFVSRRVCTHFTRLLTSRNLQTSSVLNMPAKVGDSIPDVDLFEDAPTNTVNLAKASAGKKIIVFAVPGAFTPGCSKTHLPGYVQKADELKKQGVAEIYCVAVNDPFVMAAWGNDQKTSGKVRMLADPKATFTKALDLTVDLPPLGGVRSKRYSMVVENGKITSLQVEPDGTGLSCSLADKIKRARIVVLIGGLPKKACTLQKKLFEKNLDEVRKIAMYMAEFNPKAILCIARPPVNFLVPLASEEYIKAEVYDPRKIMGVTTIALMRANTVLAKHSNKSAARVICPVIGGVCPMTTTAVFSQAKPTGNFDEDTHDKLQAKIGQVEDLVLKIKEKEKSGPLSLAHALATSRFVNSVVKALNGEKNCVECAFVRQTGHICKFLPYMMSIVVLGKEGIKSCHMPKVNKHEAKRLKCAHTYLMKQIAIGRSIATGGVSVKEQKRCLNREIKCEIIQESEKKRKGNKTKGKKDKKGKKGKKKKRKIKGKSKKCSKKAQRSKQKGVPK